MFIMYIIMCTVSIIFANLVTNGTRIDAMKFSLFGSIEKFSNYLFLDELAKKIPLEFNNDLQFQRRTC